MKSFIVILLFSVLFIGCSKSPKYMIGQEIYMQPDSTKGIIIDKNDYALKYDILSKGMVAEKVPEELIFIK